MADFEIIGTVVERGTKRGVQGLRVEAWDRDTRYHDMLGSTVTDGAGRFRVRFDTTYFGDYAPDRQPDVFYRVFRDDALILSTQDHPSENEPGPRIVVTLEIDPLVEPEAAPDRVDPETAMKILTFVRESDFRGVRREATDQLTLGRGFLVEMLKGSFQEWDWKPIRPSDVRGSDVVGQDTETAQTRLASQNITVAEVQEYNPQVNRDWVRALASPPVRLQPGDRVVLYQQDGQVQYYARVREQPAATIDQEEVRQLAGEVETVRQDVGTVDALRNEVASLKAAAEQERGKTASDVADLRGQLDELAALRGTVTTMQAELTQRNQTIAALQADLAKVRASQERIEESDLVQRLGRLEGAVRKP
jgi:hypothetical protein